MRNEMILALVLLLDDEKLVLEELVIICVPSIWL